MLPHPELQRTLLWLAFAALVLGGPTAAMRTATAQIRSLSYGINEAPIPASKVIQASALRASHRISDNSQEYNGEDLSSAAMHLDDQRTDRSVRGRHTAPEVIPVGEELPPGSDKPIELIEFDDIALSEAMRLFAEQSGLNVITSAEAGKTMVTAYLKKVTAINALEAIVKANGLFYRIEPNSGIVRIATLKEYEKDLASFREEQTRVFTLLYPNPTAVSQVIQQVFGDRVQLSRADADVEDLIDLSRRFSRFDLVDGRSLGLGGSNNTNQSGGANSANGAFGGLGMAASAGGLGAFGQNGNFGNNSQSQRGLARPTRNLNSDNLTDLSADEIQKLENQLAADGRLSENNQADLMQRREATIYVSTIRRNNQVIVRTGDSRSMEQIAALVTQLDVPTPTVLLEVKVLRVVLADGFNSAFEYFGGADKVASSMSDGSLAPAFQGATSVARGLGEGLGVSGAVPGALTFQMVDKNFRMRMQLL